MDNLRLLTFVKFNLKPAVLATIVGVEGHSYRKVGACMLLLEGGERIGSLSPGCLEEDLLHRVQEVWGSGKPCEVAYDMQDQEDPVWGEAAGCGGKLRILLEPVIEPLRSLLLNIHWRMERSESSWLYREQLAEGIQYKLLQQPPENQSDAAVLAFLSPPRLILFGAGLDAVPLAELSQKLGFRVVVTDWREELCTAQRFPGCETLVGAPMQLAEALTITMRDYIVVLSHQFDKDKAFLSEAAQASPYYLGILGSKARVERLLSGLPSLPSALHAPIGISIGARGPEEIAVSVAAELIAVRNAISTQRLKGEELSEGGGNLFGGWREQADGQAEAVPGTIA